MLRYTNIDLIYYFNCFIFLIVSVCSLDQSIYNTVILCILDYMFSLTRGQLKLNRSNTLMSMYAYSIYIPSSELFMWVFVIFIFRKYFFFLCTGTVFLIDFSCTFIVSPALSNSLTSSRASGTGTSS